ncbi:MAG: Mitochondrial dicarboxylate transporter [Peltula sp. TS41687]|nr:MAG: Mitochondrial dicarboxylate transporter [Peltula sp. TS41687]
MTYFVRKLTDLDDSYLQVYYVNVSLLTFIPAKTKTSHPDAFHPTTVTYSTTRFGVYEELKETFSTARQSPSFPTLIGMASASGLLGGIAGNPADVLNVRMQHDASLPASERRNYQNAVDGLVRMTREEGVRSLFRGLWPNSIRALLMTASQLASYDGFKRVLLDRTTLRDNLTTHFSASFLAGFVATTICSPVDVIKTRLMSAKSNEGGLRLLVRVYRAEGWSWVFRGWVPSFVRLGPHTIATFLFLEQFKRLWRYVHPRGREREREWVNSTVGSHAADSITTEGAMAHQNGDLLAAESRVDQRFWWMLRVGVEVNAAFGRQERDRGSMFTPVKDENTHTRVPP